MFDPMFVGPPDPLTELLGVALLGLAFLGFAVGLYWLHRIAKDIEDN